MDTQMIESIAEHLFEESEFAYERSPTDCSHYITAVKKHYERYDAMNDYLRSHRLMNLRIHDYAFIDSTEDEIYQSTDNDFNDCEVTGISRSTLMVVIDVDDQLIMNPSNNIPSVFCVKHTDWDDFGNGDINELDYSGKIILISMNHVILSSSDAEKIHDAYQTSIELETL